MFMNMFTGVLKIQCLIYLSHNNSVIFSSCFLEQKWKLTSNICHVSLVFKAACDFRPSREFRNQLQLTDRIQPYNPRTPKVSFGGRVWKFGAWGG